ncbi:MAG: hypothetical protein AAGF93_00475 [Cyanobacteria bacterium P01_H01_bin.105]
MLPSSGERQQQKHLPVDGMDGLTKVGQGAIARIEDIEVADLDFIGQKCPQMKSGHKAILYILLAVGSLINPSQAAWASMNLVIVPIVMGVLNGAMGILMVGRAAEEDERIDGEEEEEGDSVVDVDAVEVGEADEDGGGNDQSNQPHESVGLNSRRSTTRTADSPPTSPRSTRRSYQTGVGSPPRQNQTQGPNPSDTASRSDSLFEPSPWTEPLGRPVRGELPNAHGDQPLTEQEAQRAMAEFLGETPTPVEQDPPVEPVELRADTPHLLLWGRTQSGKTTTAARLFKGSVWYVTVKVRDSVPQGWKSFRINPQFADAQVNWVLDQWEPVFYQHLDDMAQGSSWFVVDEIISICELVEGSTAKRLVSFIKQIITAGASAGAFVCLMTQATNAGALGFSADLLRNCAVVACSGQRKTNLQMAKAFSKYTGYTFTDEQLSRIGELNGYWQIWDNDGPCLSQFDPSQIAMKAPEKCPEELGKKPEYKNIPKNLSGDSSDEDAYHAVERRRKAPKKRLKLSDKVPTLTKTYADVITQIIRWFEGTDLSGEEFYVELSEKDLYRKFRSDERAAIQPYIKPLLKHIAKSNSDFEQGETEDGMLTLVFLKEEALMSIEFE